MHDKWCSISLHLQSFTILINWLKCNTANLSASNLSDCKGSLHQNNAVIITMVSSDNLGGSPGLVVMGGDSCPIGSLIESWHCILDGHFSHIFVVKIVMMFV